jgi:hypothetical protein
MPGRGWHGRTSSSIGWPETVKLGEIWAGLPRRWKAKIRRSLSQALDIVPLEKGIIERLQYLLV